MELEAMSDLNHTPGSFAAVGDIASMCDRPQVANIWVYTALFLEAETQVTC